MSAQALTPFVPPHALRIWADRDRLFIAYPAANQGADFIVDYPNNPTGLTCALAAMIKAYEEAHPLPRSQPSAPTRIAAPGQRKHTGKPSASLSADDRSAALAALIAAGILPPGAGN